MRCCDRAHEEAERCGAAEVEIAHLVYVAASDPAMHAAFAAHHVHPEWLVAEIDAELPRGMRHLLLHKPGTSPDLKTLLARAVEVATRRRSDAVSIDDLLNALFFRCTDLASGAAIARWRQASRTARGGHSVAREGEAPRRVGPLSYERPAPHGVRDAGARAPLVQIARREGHSAIGGGSISDLSERLARQEQMIAELTARLSKPRGRKSAVAAGDDTEQAATAPRKRARGPAQNDDAAAVSQSSGASVAAASASHDAASESAARSAKTTTSSTSSSSSSSSSASASGSAERMAKFKRLRRYAWRAARNARRTAATSSHVRLLRDAAAARRFTQEASDLDADLADERDAEFPGADDGEAYTGDPAMRAKKFFLTLDDDVVQAPSIGPRTAARLAPFGITRVSHLLTCDPVALAAQMGARSITRYRIAAWQDQARLVCTVPWLRGTHAQMLVGAGYTTVEKILADDRSAVCAAILRFATTRDGMSVLRNAAPPDMDKIIRWIEHARLAEPERAAA